MKVGCVNYLDKVMVPNFVKIHGLALSCSCGLNGQTKWIELLSRLIEGHLHGYVKRDIEKYLFMTIVGNLDIRLLGVFCERTNGLWALNIVDSYH